MGGLLLFYPAALCPSRLIKCLWLVTSITRTWPWEKKADVIDLEPHCSSLFHMKQDQPYEIPVKSREVKVIWAVLVAHRQQHFIGAGEA